MGRCYLPERCISNFTRCPLPSWVTLYRLPVSQSPSPALGGISDIKLVVDVALQGGSKVVLLRSRATTTDPLQPLHGPGQCQRVGGLGRCTRSLEVGCTIFFKPFQQNFGHPELVFIVCAVSPLFFSPFFPEVRFLTCSCVHIFHPPWGFRPPPPKECGWVVCVSGNGPRSIA